MAVSRTQIVDDNFSRFVSERRAVAQRVDLDSPVRAGATLSARDALRLFEAQVESRLCDLVSRELKAEGQSFYTIGSAGHEGNAAVADALDPADMAFLHYRSGAFFCARAAKTPGPEGPFDVLLGAVASTDEPIAGGRHKVFGSVALNIPPQTSTIASQLPKALGFAVASDRRARLDGLEPHRIAMCSFGDASANHATAVAAINSACWCSFQRVPAPVLFVCEDNGFGISVRTPRGWIATNFGARPGLAYYSADGCDLAEAWDAAQQAVAYVRTERRPAFLHLRTVRMLGHAGSDVEQLYRTEHEIEATEAADPLHHTAAMLIDEGWLTPADVLALYEDSRRRIRALGQEATRRPKLQTREAVMTPLYSHDADAVAAAVPVAASDRRAEWWANRLPEAEARPRHLAVQLNRALSDLMLAVPESILFGEDVAKKGGVYHVTSGLTKKLGVGRVFNTLLDETTILGLAIGAGHAGMVPIPEIQYLAYLMNAVDQLRGEAGSMQFFSQGQYANPMVVRIASLAYQRGFGGHFHNDNGIAALREIPGLLIGCPARGDDAVRMLRTLFTCAKSQGRVTVMLEPIARYMTKDLHDEGDGGWLTSYPAPDESMPIGEVGVYDEGVGPPQICVATYANGLFMTLRVARRLAAEGMSIRVIDLRWLQPLPIDSLLPHARAAGRLLVVDECRASSGIADSVISLTLAEAPDVRMGRVVAPDTYIPLGGAANLVLVQEHDIEAGLRALAAAP